MTTKTMPKLDKKMFVQPARSVYPTLGAVYCHQGHEFHYSDRLVNTGKNFYDTEADIPKKLWVFQRNRDSTAAEELAIQLELERSGEDPRKAEAFADFFGRFWYARLWTKTGLRIPKGWENGRYEVNKNGNKKWPRIVLIGDQEVGEVLVPEGGGRVVKEWDEVFGIPAETSDSEDDMKPENHTTHFRFDSSPKGLGSSYLSGYEGYDVAVTRNGEWPGEEPGNCLLVAALDRRCYASGGNGFRLVRGSLPRIEKKSV